MVTNPVVFLLTGAEAEGSAIPEAVPVESQAPETQGAAGGAPEPMEVDGREAPAMAGGEHDDVLPESTLEVVVRSPKIQDAEPIRWRQCLEPPRVVVVGFSCWQMTLSTRQRWLVTWRRCARPNSG
jgi:hypothetical protein